MDKVFCGRKICVKMNLKRLNHYGREEYIMQKALEGIKILEIGDGLTQFAGKMLADMGAEVIKVEPKEGVESRHIGPFYKDELNVDQSLYFWHFNTSKKSIILDLYEEEDRNKLDRKSVV